MVKRTLFALIIVGCLFVSLDSFAQFYTNGDDPASVKWKMLKGNHYSVIYPGEIDSLAKRYFFLLESNRRNIMTGLKMNPTPLPVVLHPYTVRSNGFVVWAPKRVELYTQPCADNFYAQNWEEQLVLHESRHIGQMDHFTKGVFKPLGWLIGQQAPGLGVALYPYIWLMEGDAVVAETELSENGRGRSASFLAYYRMAFLNGDYRSWNAWRFGSLKYRTPDPYALGYMILSTARYRTGNYYLSGDIFNSMVRRFYNPFVRDYSFRKIAGFNPRSLMRETERFMTDFWKKEEQNSGTFSRTVAVTVPKDNYFSDYKAIVSIASCNSKECPDTLYAVRSSYNSPTSLVRILKYPDKKSEEQILRPFSASVSGRICYSRGRLFWSETVNDIRWGKKSYNDLFRYDVESGDITRISEGCSYNNPAISVTGDTIAVSEYHIKGGSSVSLLCSDSGRKLCSFAAPDNGQVIESVFNGDTLYASVITENGIGIYSLLFREGDWKLIFAPQRYNIRDLCGDISSTGFRLLFSSDIDGVDNIFSLDVSSSRISRLTNSRYGVWLPAKLGQTLYCVELGKNSNNVVTITTVDPDSGNKPVTPYRFNIAERLSEQAVANLRTICDSVEIPEPVPYKKVSNLFRIHSWVPLYYNVDRLKQMSYDNFYEVAGLGATIYSQNTLGTAITMLGYSYRNDDKSEKKNFHAGHFRFTYSGWYPVIELNADFNSEARYKRWFQYDSSNNKTKQYSKEISSPYFEAGVTSYVPFVFDKNGWQKGLIPQISYKVENNLFDNRGKYVPYDQVKFTLQGYVMRPVAKAGIYPRIGAGFVARYAASPSGYDLFSPLAAIKTYFYLPGIFSSHGLRLSAEYQRQFTDSRAYFVKNIIDMPVGYDGDVPAEHLYKAGASYALPIYLNDLNLGFFAYLQRIQINPFVDFGAYKRHIKGNSGNLTGSLCSIGADFMLDGYFFRVGAPVSIGFRYAHLKYDSFYDNGKNYFTLLFMISLTR